MKKIALILLLFISSFSFAQVYCGYIAIPRYMYFDNNEQNWEYILEIDTIHNQYNIWQIGKPNKLIIDTAYSNPNVIITDTSNSYPANDTSFFYIKHIDNGGYSTPHSAEFAGYYYVNSDSLNDFGLIEFSPDNGTTWIDIITDTLYQNYIYWDTPKPVLTGNSNGWQNFMVTLDGLGHVFDINWGDTILLKVSWISDEILDTLDGLAFDNFEFCDGTEEIEENGYKKKYSRIYPNPSNEKITIEFENSTSITFQLKIYNNLGKILKQKGNIKNDKIEINVDSYKSGIYFYKLINFKERITAQGKFTIED